MSFITNFHSIMDNKNSTIIPLTSNNCFIGASSNVIGYNSVSIFLVSAVGNSSSNGLILQSSDIGNTLALSTSSTIIGNPVSNKLTLNGSDNTTGLEYFIIITSGPFLSQNSIVSSLSLGIVTMISNWNPVKLSNLLITSIIVSSSGSLITLIGTGFIPGTITPGTSIEVVISNLVQQYLVTSITTDTSSNIVLVTNGNSTSGTCTGLINQYGITFPYTLLKSLTIASTTITLVGIGLSTTTFTIGSIIQYYISNIPYYSTVTSIGTNTNTNIVLNTTTNSITGVGTLTYATMLPNTTISSIIVSTSGTIVTIIGTGLNTNSIIVGSIIQVNIGNILQNYTVSSIGTPTTTLITLTTTGNTTIGTGSDELFILNPNVIVYNPQLLLISPGSGVTYNSGLWYSDFTDTYYSSIKYTKSLKLNKPFYRIIYINDGLSQTVFNLSSSITPTKSNEINVTLNKKHIDLYGNQKTVSPTTLLELKFYPFGIALDILSNSIYSSNNLITGVISNTTMNIIANAGSSGIFLSQSKHYVIYQPGKTFVIYATGVINNGGNVGGGGSNTNGTTTDIGYFDTILTASNPSVGGNGIYFSFNPILGISVNLLNSRTGIVISIPQYLWNEDRMDGTGESGINLDFTKYQFFFMRFSWHGGGPIQFGFNVLENLHIVHTINNYNSLTYPWMSNPNLPITYRLTTNTSSDIGSLLQGCASIISEGGYNPNGHMFSASNISTPILVGNAVEVPMLAITGCTNTTIGIPTNYNSNGIAATTNTYYHHPITLKSLTSITTSTNNTVLISIRLYPSGTPFQTTIRGVNWIDVNTSSSLMKVAQGGTSSGLLSNTGSVFTIVDSILLWQGYTNSTNPINIDYLNNSFSKIGSNYSNICDIIIITGMYINGSATNAVVSLGWEELY